MLLAADPQKLTLLISIVAVLTVHYFLALLALMRMLKTNGHLKAYGWHFVIQLAVIAGPVIYLILHKKPAQNSGETARVERQADETSAADPTGNKTGPEISSKETD